MNRMHLLGMAFLVSSLMGPPQVLGTEPIGLESMLAFDRLPYFREGVRCAQSSSHDPTGGNADGSYGILYTEEGNYVLFDEIGPGCLYRIWFTGIGDAGRIQFYFDGEETPRVDLDIDDFFSGAVPPFLSPLVGNDAVSSGGFYSYMPMPFASRLRVMTTGDPMYFQFTHHLFSSADGVATFTGTEDPSEVIDMWLNAGDDPKGGEGDIVIADTLRIGPGETGRLAGISGAGSINRIIVEAGHTEAELGDSSIRMYWDGEEAPSVDSPLGEFFGSGLGEAHVKALPVGMLTGGFGPGAKWHDWFAPANEVPEVGDFNGDGLDDIVTFVGDGRVYAALSTGSSFEGTGVLWHGSFHMAGEVPGTGDFDGDGLDDIVTFVGDGRVYAALSTGSSFEGTAVLWHDWFCLADEVPGTGDFNGDGLDDVIAFDLADSDVYVALSDGSGFVGTGLAWHSGFGHAGALPVVADYTGDGLSDILLFDPSTHEIYGAFSDGTGFVGHELFHNDFLYPGEIPRTGDINGDGLDDILAFTSDFEGDVYVALAGPVGFGSRVKWHDWFAPGDEIPHAGDFDGDGLDDIVTFVSDTGGDVWVAISKGETDSIYYCYFPMPFWSGAVIEIHNGSASDKGDLGVTYEVHYSTQTYDDDAGYFKVQRHSETPTIPGRDYTILDVTGRGHYVGCVHTMESIGSVYRHYLEGDERIHIDGSMSPALYGTGTEDYYNGGWYFNQGPFSLPSHGNPVHRADSVDRTGCYRMHLSDLVPFTSALKVGIEHGGQDDVQGDYRSIAYYYHREEPSGILTDVLDVGNKTSEMEHEYEVDGLTTVGSRTESYEGDDDDVPITDDWKAFTGYSRFRVACLPDNKGVRLRRRLDYCIADQEALVSVDGAPVGTWYTAGSNCQKKWRDSDFDIPASFTSGKDSLQIEVAFLGSAMDWNEFAYWIYSFQDPAPEFTLDLDASYSGGTLALSYTLGTPQPATWANYLILTQPGVQVVPLWTVPLPVIDPPLELPMGLPFPSLGWVGIYTALFTAEGQQAVELAWVDTG